MVDKHNGAVLSETPDIPPDAAKQACEQYVASRFGSLSPEMRQAMGFAKNPEMYMHTELMFRQCFWRERHDLLEKNAQVMIRRILAMRGVIFTLIKDANPGMAHQVVREHSARRIETEEKKLPMDFEEIPEL